MFFAFIFLYAAIMFITAFFSTLQIIGICYSSVTEITEDGQLTMGMQLPPEAIEDAKAQGAPVTEDGMIVAEQHEWKEENGELFYNTGDECEIDGEAVDPWIKIEFDEDGLLVLTMMAFEKI